jgi:multiple sugar transport system permease protein
MGRGGDVAKEAVAAKAAYRPRRRASAWARSRNLRFGLLFCSPWILGILFFYAYPTIASFYYSLTEYNLLQSPSFIGLGNYNDLIHDPVMLTSIGNTIYYMVIFVPINIVLGILVALLLNLKVRGMAVYRTAFYMPTLVPAVATSLLWLWVLNPQYGIFNWFLGLLGIPGPGWLASTTWSKPSIIIISLWGGIGGAMLLFLATLQDVRQDLIEAATVDGANAFQRFFAVTLPSLTPVIFYQLVTGIIFAIQYFTVPYVVTGGTGVPANSLMLFAVYLFNNAFFNFKMGYASAMAWAATVVVFILTFIIFRTSSSWVYYGSGEAR